MDLMQFLTVLLLTFSLVMILAGAFTAYFGSGKSRMIGVVLLVIGLIVGVVWGYLGYADMAGVEGDISEVIWVAFVNILAALIGALVAVGAFLLAIIKS